MKLHWLSTALLLAATSTVAHAQWRAQAQQAVAAPQSTNSTLAALTVGCGDPFRIALHTADGAPVLPQAGGAADYLYRPGKIIASVDDHDWPLVAAASDIAMVLFSEGTVAENHLAPLDRQLIDALRQGRRLVLYFDITDANAADGSPFETFAAFSLDGAQDTLAVALDGCP